MRCRFRGISQAPTSGTGKRRRGIAAVELALLAPFLVFLLLIAVDYCRLFYYSQVVTQCARNEALYIGDPFAATQSPYADYIAAAKADASPEIQSQLNTPAPVYNSDTNGSYADVTVSYPFTTLTNYPGIPSSVTITRTVRVRVAPAAPN